MVFDKFPFYNQFDSVDCGPASLKMILKFYGKDVCLEYLREKCKVSKLGSNLNDIENTAIGLGFNCSSVKISLLGLIENNIYPALLLWEENHFVVLYKVKNDTFFIADPAYGKVKINKSEFINKWERENSEGIAMLLYPNKDFNQNSVCDKKSKYAWLSFLYQKAKNHKLSFLFILTSVLFSGLLISYSPFLSKTLIDEAIPNRSINFVLIILLAQVVLFVGYTIFDLLGSWISLHSSIKISIRITTDFVLKLINSNYSFFEQKTIGDINQRISDNERIESFLTSQLFEFVFVLILLVGLPLIIGYFSIKLFCIYTMLSILSVVWVFLLMKKRKALDFVRFQYLKQNQDFIIETTSGIKELKVNNAIEFKKNEWIEIQKKIYHFNYKSLKLEHTQRIGFDIINQIKDFTIIYISAISVIYGELTLGALLSISFIMGQLNSSLFQLPDFIRAIQDAKLSTDRILEVDNLKPENESWSENNEELTSSKKITGDINFKNVNFSYDGVKNQIIKNVTFTIPENKITAIVGLSGSGKTTLLKLLLGLYKVDEGVISINNIPITSYHIKNWRTHCGVVFQNGYIFSDSLKNNITMGKPYDEGFFYECISTANIIDFVSSLPLGVETNIGSNGIGLSQGQKQRILIARALYKNPRYLFLDEATSSLDAKTERVIVDNLNKYFKNRTVFIIAHRLSTVKNADKILVMNDGIIIEEGSHKSLTEHKGFYYSLIKNQIDLG